MEIRYTNREYAVRFIAKYARFHALGIIFEGEFCENVILTIVISDQAFWSDMLCAAGPDGLEKLKNYCERIDLADETPLYQALFAGPQENIKPEEKEELRSIYSKLSQVIQNASVHDES